MTQNEAFLQAIIEKPDDDSLRLIYADFLDERGDPRGEFIRVQCDMACLHVDDSRRAVLEARERELLVMYADAWVRPLNLPAKDVTFRRGFVECIDTDARTLLASGQEWFRLTPLRHLTAWGYQGNFLRQEETSMLVPWPQLAHLRSLRLTENEVGDAGAAALAASPFVASLEVLDLGNNHIGA